MSADEAKKPINKNVISKAISAAKKKVETLLSKKERSQAQLDDSVRPEIMVGTTVSLSADSHRHGGGGGVLAAGETGIVVALEGNYKAR